MPNIKQQEKRVRQSARQRTENLRTRFGPEYDRTVRQTGDVSRAEASLEARAKRVERLHIRPLAPEDAARFADAWRRVQAQFVDDPRGAITQADRLVGEVMHARGKIPVARQTAMPV